MILVTVGTGQYPFDRLIEAVDSLAAQSSLHDDVFIQRGSCTYAPKSCRFEDWIPFQQMMEYIRKASMVISHAGVGSIVLCCQHGHRPIVMPRRPAFGELVDDHQLAFARKLHALGIVRNVEDASDVGAAIRQARVSRKSTREKSTTNELIAFLRGQCSRWELAARTESE
jgi:UDP-N-acetylglucosamine transferase subunit ALG13